MTEYSWCCTHCGDVIRTDDLPGTTCSCGKSQVNWIAANKALMADRVRSGNRYAMIVSPYKE